MADVKAIPISLWFNETVAKKILPKTVLRIYLEAHSSKNIKL